jgi:rod shape-determining protein MreD
MRKSRYLAIIFILGILQVTVVDHFKVFGAKPDFILMAVVISSFFYDWKWALIFSLISGALKDMFTADAVAINTILSALWSFLVVQLVRRVNLDMNLIRAGLIFIVAILNACALRIFFLYSGVYVPLGIFLRTAFLGSLYTALTSLLLFKILKIK